MAEGDGGFSPKASTARRVELPTRRVGSPARRVGSPLTTLVGLSALAAVTNLNLNLNPNPSHPNLNPNPNPARSLGSGPACYVAERLFSGRAHPDADTARVTLSLTLALN